MYLYIFKDEKMLEEVFTNETDSSLLWMEMEKLVDKNGTDSQVVVSKKRFMSPKLYDAGVKDEMGA